MSRNDGRIRLTHEFVIDGDAGKTTHSTSLDIGFCSSTFALEHLPDVLAEFRDHVALIRGEAPPQRDDLDVLRRRR
jgi:hypothetical protein